MIDWLLAIKIACGGFGLVFLVLVILGISVWLVKLIVYKAFREEDG